MLIVPTLIEKTIPSRMKIKEINKTALSAGLSINSINKLIPKTRSADGKIILDNQNKSADFATDVVASIMGQRIL